MFWGFSKVILKARLKAFVYEKTELQQCSNVARTGIKMAIEKEKHTRYVLETFLGDGGVVENYSLEENR